MNRNDLILDNMGLVHKHAYKYPPWLREDLIQAGLEGLTKAANLYDPERGFAFSTYAFDWIRSHMQRCTKESGFTLTITNRQHLAMRTVSAAEGRLLPKGVPVTPEMIAEETGLEIKEVEVAIRYVEPLSLDYEPPDSDGWRPYQTTLGEPDDYSGIELRDMLDRIPAHLARAVTYPVLGYTDREMMEQEGLSRPGLADRRRRGMRLLRKHGQE